VSAPVGASRHSRIGFVVPSSNTVVETLAPRLLPTDGSVSSHVARVRVTTISPTEATAARFYDGAILEAAEALAEAEVDLIVWHGTAAGWLGFDRDDALVAAIRERTGCPALTALRAVNARLAALGARRIGLVTPYVAELEARIAANYAEAGIAVVAAARLDLTCNTAFAEVRPERVAAMAAEVAAARPDAIVVLCTNLDGATVAARVTTELGVPVVDSVRETFAAALSHLGLENRA
jgi:maleate isomerase